MTRRNPLPPELAAAFRVADAQEAGVPRTRLRASDLTVPSRGIRARVQPPEVHRDARGRIREPTAAERLTARLRPLLPALGDSQFVCAETALTLVGSPLPFGRFDPDIHVAAYRPSATPRRKEFIGHRLRARERAAGLVAGIPCEHPARAWRQASTTWEVDDLIAAGDHLVRPNGLLTIADLEAEIEAMGDVRGKLREALGQIRVGAESPEETRLRLVLSRAGLPEPTLNRRLLTVGGQFVARLDLAWLQYRVGAEYDGRVHAEDIAQFRADADRWDAIRAAGWVHVRILSHHMRPDPDVAVRKVGDALVAAGWRPSLRGARR